MCKYGDLYIVEKDMADTLQRLKQIVLVVSADNANKISPVATVVPVIDAAGQEKLSDYVLIGNYGMSEENIAVIERITTLNQTKLLIKVGSIRGTVYDGQIKQAIKKYLGL